jgi:hypothetical protein
MNALAPQGQTKPLQRQPTDDLRRPLLILFSAYPDYSKTQDEADARTAAYLLALSTFPEWAVRESVTRFVQGHVERRNRDKIPTAEQIAAEAREIVNDEAEKRRQQNIIDQQRKEREAEEQRRADRGSQEDRAAHVQRLLGRSIKTME